MPTESKELDVRKHRIAAGFWVTLICVGLLAAAWYTRPKEEPVYDGLRDETIAAAAKDTIRKLLRNGNEAEFVEPFAIEPVTFANGKAFTVRGQMTAASESGETITRPFTATIEHASSGQLILIAMEADGMEVARDLAAFARLSGTPATSSSTSR